MEKLLNWAGDKKPESISLALSAVIKEVPLAEFALLEIEDWSEASPLPPTLSSLRKKALFRELKKLAAQNQGFPLFFASPSDWIDSKETAIKNALNEQLLDFPIEELVELEVGDWNDVEIPEISVLRKKSLFRELKHVLAYILNPKLRIDYFEVDKKSVSSNTDDKETKIVEEAKSTKKIKPRDPVDSTSHANEQKKKEVKIVTNPPTTKISYPVTKDSPFHDIDKNNYKAAGVMVIRRHPVSGKPELLLPIELRDYGTNQLHVFGGKRDYTDTSIEHTASREFSEEVAEIVKLEEASSLVIGAPEKMWYGKGKFGLVLIPGGDKKTLPQLMNAPDDYAKRRYRYRGAEASLLTWQPVERLLKATQVKVKGKSYPISGMLKDILASDTFQSCLNSFCERKQTMDVRKRVESEIQETLDNVKMLESPNTQLEGFKKLMNLDSPIKDINELIRIPKIPATPTISIVAPSDPFYKKILALVPVANQSSVKFIRRASVAARTQIWQKAHNTTYPNSSEKFPLFHGTPDTWRATAISYQGFNLGIKLNGRASGDGAYSTEDFSYARGYAGQNGSMLVMKGILGGKPAAPLAGAPPIHVFPDPNCVLPVAIIDFGPIDKNDTAFEEDYIKKKKEREDKMKKMKIEVKNFYSDVISTGIDVYQLYLDKLCQWNQLLQQEEIPEDLCLSINREIFQKQLNLPIYAKKDSLLQSIESSNLCIVEAATGSGKSTQIPQYMLDHIVPKGKQVIVLQPRRINAEKLAERVSHERGCAVGEEVGWRVGLGGGEYSSSTKIIFMTHGLFSNIMFRGSTSFLKNVGAIVLDEAHEKSLDIDSCLGHVKLLMEKEEWRDIKIVITSATIDSSKFKQLFKNSCERTNVCQLPGITFPVWNEFRPLVDVTQEDLGTAGNSTVRMSAAIQAVSELVENTEKGNILIFVPGKAEARLGKQRIESFIYNELKSGNGSEGNASNFVSCLVDSVIEVLGFSKGKKKEGKEEKKKEEKKRRKTVEVVSLHSGSSPEDKYALFSSKADQLVVFATNVAETGLTIPNVSYVVDVGQSRSAEWVNKFGMNILTTNWISKSSANQRKGRAGRVCPGYCLRLYSEQEYNEFPPNSASSINSSNIERTLLFLHELKDSSKGNLLPHAFPLPEPIDPEVFLNTCKKLEQFELLKRENANANEFHITEYGKQVNALGIDIRLGRFVIACCANGCGRSGSIIAALLIAGADRRLVADWKHIQELDPDLISPLGDHMTLLNIYDEYSKQWHKNNAVQWAIDRKLSIPVLDEVFMLINYLEDSISKQKLPLDVPSRQKEKEEAIEIALSVSFFDQICLVTSGSSLVRLLPKNEIDAWNEIQKKVNGSDDEEEEEREEEAVVKLNNNSVLRKFNSLDPNSLVVFTSVLRTDKASEPKIYAASIIKKATFVAQSKEWCQQVDFDEIWDNAKRVTRKVKEVKKNTWTANKGANTKRLQKKFPSASISYSVSDDNTFCFLVTAKEFDMERICRFIMGIEKEVSDVVSVVLHLEDDSNLSFFNRKQFDPFRKEFRNRWDAIIKTKMVIQMEFTPSPPSVTITCGKGAKPYLYAIVGDFQSQLEKNKIGNQLTATGPADGDTTNRISERMVLLLNNSPLTPSSRDKLLIITARFVLQECGATIYGGFLRDWLIRNEQASDIDCCLPASKNFSSLPVQAFAKEWGLTITPIHAHKLKTGDFLTTIKFSVISNPTIQADVDFVEKKSAPMTRCDADVNNIQLRCDSKTHHPVFEQKTTGDVGYSLNDTLDNILKKKFNFYLDFGSDPSYIAGRAQKLLNKGYACVSGIPAAQSSRFPQHQSQIQFS